MINPFPSELRLVLTDQTIKLALNFQACKLREKVRETESEMERGSLVLEEMGLNNQHEVGGEGWWRENGEDDD